MKATNLEYKKEYRHIGEPDKRCVFLGQEGKKYWFVSVDGKNSRICSGKWWMTEKQIEDLLTDL